jgi:hypothetical protein
MGVKGALQFEDRTHIFMPCRSQLSHAGRG